MFVIQSDCNKKSRLSTGSGDGSSSGSNALMDSVNTSIGERRRRRKTKHEVLQDADDGVFSLCLVWCL